MTDLGLIRANLFRRKLRLVLMMVSIFVAFLLFGVLVSFERAFNAGEAVAANNRLIVANRINFTQPLPYAYFNRVQGVDGVVRVSHSNWFGGYFQEPRNFLITFAVEPESWLQIYRDDFIIDPAQRAAFLADRGSMMVGRTLADRYGWAVGDRVPISSNLFSNRSTGRRTWDFTVAAIYDGADERVDASQIYLHYSYFNETRNFGRDFLGTLVVETEGPDRNDPVIRAIDGMFANSPFETSTDTEAAFQKAFAAQFGNIALIVTLVTGAAFVTILMIVGNTMAMAVRERTREIGVMKTLGFPAPRIFRLVLGESLLLALLGGLPGLGAAALACMALGPGIANFAPGMMVTPGIWAAGVALMLLLGLVTGGLPAWNAMRLNIVTALGRG